MVRFLLQIFGRILTNLHLIIFIGLLSSGQWILDRTGEPEWKVGLAVLGIFVLLIFIRGLILAKYVTGKWNPRELWRFHTADHANRFYDPWEQKRLYKETF
ncbi:MAG: hypothetical protein AB8D78_03580 [Akkermansiaceae bacterium]